MYLPILLTKESPRHLEMNAPLQCAIFDVASGRIDLSMAVGQKRWGDPSSLTSDNRDQQSSGQNSTRVDT